MKNNNPQITQIAQIGTGNIAPMPRNPQAELEMAEAELERRQLALKNAQAQEQRLQAAVKSQELVVNTLKMAVQKMRLTKR